MSKKVVFETMAISSGDFTSKADFLRALKQLGEEGWEIKTQLSIPPEQNESGCRSVDVLLQRQKD